MGFRVQGSGFGVWGWDIGLRVSGCRVWGAPALGEVLDDLVARLEPVHACEEGSYLRLIDLCMTFVSL